MTKPKTTPIGSEAGSHLSITVREDGGRLGVAIGRGDGGKTTLLRWAAERAMAQGRTLYIGDGDPMNRTLAAIFHDLNPPVLEPGDASDAARAAFIRRLAELSRTTGAYVALDVGGNDRELEKAGRGVDEAKMARLSSWGRQNLKFDALGVRVAAFYVLRGAVNDLTGLDMILSSAVGRQDLVLVLNHGRAPALPPGEDPFRQMREHDVYRRAIAQGAREFNMPALPAGAAKYLDDNRMKFLDALDGIAPPGRKPLDPWEQEALAVWLGDLEDEVRRSGIEQLLP